MVRGPGFVLFPIGTILMKANFGRLADPDSSLNSVSLSPRDLDDAARILSRLTGIAIDADARQSASRGSNVRPTDRLTPEQRAPLVARAREAVQSRRNRVQGFNPAMFGEPAWDMLLILYVTETSGMPQTVTTLSRLSGASSTTALRWLDYLKREKLVSRQRHPSDRRLSYVTLTKKGRDALDAHFAGVLDSAASSAGGNDPQADLDAQDRAAGGPST